MFDNFRRLLIWWWLQTQLHICLHHHIFLEKKMVSIYIFDPMILKDASRFYLEEIDMEISIKIRLMVCRDQ